MTDAVGGHRPGMGLGAGVGLRLEGTRRESTLGEAQHSVGVRGRLQFR